MSQTSKTSFFVLSMLLFQIILSFFWIDIVYAFWLDTGSQLILTQFLIFILPMACYFMITKKPIKETLRLNSIDVGNIILIIIITLLLQPLMNLLATISSLFFPSLVEETLEDVLASPLSYSLFAMAIVPSFCEELFFRGVVFSGYRTVSLKKGIFITGLLFGIMHMNGEQFLYAFVMGMIFCYFVWKTNSIFASILAHFVFNGAQVVISHFIMHSIDIAEYSEAMAAAGPIDIWVSIIAISFTVVTTLPLLGLFLWLFHRHNKHNAIPYTLPHESERQLGIQLELQEEEKIINGPFIGILVLYVFWVFLLPPILEALFYN